MKLKNLNILNFRCFRQLKIDFADNVTVLIGKNGAGKSTLIDAIHKALSFVFISDKNYDGFLLADGIKSLKPENFHEEQDFLLDVETGRSVKEISIGAEAEIEKSSGRVRERFYQAAGRMRQGSVRKEDQDHQQRGRHEYPRRC